jgi:putative MATE family efflux protein
MLKETDLHTLYKRFSLRKGLFSDREFYKNFLTIAVPVSLQSFLTASLNLTDNIMVGQLGDASIAAVGLANQVYFILQLVLFGIGGGAAIFISQYWGGKNTENIRRVTGISLVMALAVAALFFLPAFLIPEQILSVFSSDTQVIGLGGIYLKTVCPSYMLMAFSVCLAAALRSTGNVKLPLLANIVGIVINTTLNYVLIFGMFGLPALGVRGSAIATVIARLAEDLVLIYFVYVKKNIVAAAPRELTGIPPELVKRFVSKTGAVILKELIWAVGVTIYMVVYARLGTQAYDSININNTIRQLVLVWCSGIANACLIMVGSLIGAREEERAYVYAGRFLKITLSVGVLTGILLISARGLVLSPYKVSAEVITSAGNILFINGVILAASVFNNVAIVGMMRSGGDIRFSIIMDFIAVWVIGLPLSVVAGILLRLPVELVFLLVNLQEFYKFILCLKRYRSRKWINNLVKDA